MPWIHREDAVGLLLHAGQVEIRGIMNAVSPGLIRNAEFARALGRALHRPALLPVPSPMLRIALGEVSEMLVASARVLPRVPERTGYVYRYPELDDALRTAVAPTARQAQEGRA
jgi:NAD dependent epimerase/dehydratase family enzyme